MQTAEINSLETRITALKEMLDKEQKFSESIFQSAPVGMIGVSFENIVLMANRKAEELLGRSSEELIGLAFDSIVPNANPFTNGAIDIAVPWNGSALCWKSSFVRNSEGAIAGAMLFGMTFNSISSSTIWSERMEAIQSFVGSLGHDLNNLLGAIAGYSSLVQSFAGTEEKMLTYLKSLDASIKRISEITAKSMKFAQTIKPHKQPFEMNERLNMLCNNWRQKNKSVKIETSFCKSPCHMNADWLMIEEAVRALLDNGMEAMPNGGTIHIATERTFITDIMRNILNYPKYGRYIKISVKDNGEGMDGEMIPKAFMPFFSTRDKGKGSGMGLTIAYALIKQQNGYLTLESGDGKGVIASIYLPIKPILEKIDIKETSSKEDVIP